MIQQSPKSFRNNNVNTPSNTRGSLLRKKSVFDKLGLKKIAQGSRLRTKKADSLLGKGKSFVSIMKRAKHGIAKQEMKNLSEEDIKAFDEVIKEMAKGGVSKDELSFDRVQSKRAREKFFKLYKKDHCISKEDYEDGLKILKSMKKERSPFLRRKSIDNENTKVNNDILENKSNGFQKFVAEPVSMSSSNRFKEGKDQEDELKDKDEISELEKDLNIPKPSEQEDELDDLRNQAKDLAI